MFRSSFTYHKAISIVVVIFSVGNFSVKLGVCTVVTPHSVNCITRGDHAQHNAQKHWRFHVENPGRWLNIIKKSSWLLLGWKCLHDAEPCTRLFRLCLLLTTLLTTAKYVSLRKQGKWAVKRGKWGARELSNQSQTIPNWCISYSFHAYVYCLSPWICTVWFF